MVSPLVRDATMQQAEPPTMTGGQLVVDALRTHGVAQVFCVPGESYLPVLDALYDSPINVTVCRQEGGMAMMAEAWGKMTGTPGVCLVTRGPGATNASAGLHIAVQDSTPMILLIGQVSAAVCYREAFQEINYSSVFSDLSKWVGQIESPERVPEMMSRAWHIATSGRPGPVVLVLPENMLSAHASPAHAKPWKQIETYPGSESINQIVRLLCEAKRPIAILGGSRWSVTAVRQFQQFAEYFRLPVAVSFRRQMLFDHGHDNYAGDVGLDINPKLQSRIETADLVLLIGTRFSEIPSQNYQLLKIPCPEQTLVHVYPGAEELGRVYQPDLAIHASPTAFCATLGSTSSVSQSSKDELKELESHVRRAHREYQDWSSLSQVIPSGYLVRDIMSHLQSCLPNDAIITNGAGNYCSWVNRFWKFRQYGTQLAPISGSMGYGLPAAIAAGLANSKTTVVAFAGDGCFQMTSQELGTAVQAKVAVIILLIDNGMYGTIRMHQEKKYPGRISATELINPDFCAIAKAYGAYSTTISEASDFPAAFDHALLSQGPSLIHIRVNPDAITPTQSLSSVVS